MNDSTFLHRQVHPSWVQQGRVTSQVFRPTPKDNKRLSVYDGSRITAKEAWKHYTNQLGHDSIGVLAVTVTECLIRDLRVVPDPGTFSEHILIDFTGLSGNEIIRTSKYLTIAAMARGWQYRAEGP